MRLIHQFTLCLGLFVLSFGVLNSSALAAGDIFTVSGVAVDASGETTSEAKDVALSQGRVQALQLLFQRLVPENYWNLLPQKSGEELLALERGFQVSNEKSSSTRYLADVTYSFVAENIRNELSQADIPFSEIQARSAIVVPLLERNGQNLLWEEENFWAAAWRQKNFANELVPLIPALGEIEDISAVTAETAVSGNWQSLSKLADIYGVADVMVAKAVLVDDPEGQVLQVDMRRISATESRSVASIRLRNNDQLPLDKLANLAIEQTVVRLQTAWKNQTIVNPNAPIQYLQATMRFQNIQEWVSVRRNLDNVQLIKSLDIRAMSRNGAEIAFSYSGTIDQLRVALAQEELSLLESGEINVIELLKSIEPVEGELTEGAIETDGTIGGEGEMVLDVRDPNIGPAIDSSPITEDGFGMPSEGPQQGNTLPGIDQ